MSSNNSIDLEHSKETSKQLDIDVETTHFDDSKFAKDLSENRNDMIDVDVSPKPTELSLKASQNALDLRPRVSTRKDLFEDCENVTLKRSHSDSSGHGEALSSNAPPLLTFAKRLKVSILEKTNLRIFLKYSA